MQLSKRLEAVANLVTAGLKVADVGTDHGYIPIYLLESGKNPYAIAMDINRGPLQKAKENIASHGLASYIETRLSDGLQKLNPNEAESVVIAGMGGGLVIKIMEEQGALKESIEEWILQPQSEIPKVREYLLKKGYSIIEEDMIFEDGKFYPMMKVKKGESEEYLPEEICYGKCLLRKRHPALLTFLKRELQKKTAILSALETTEGDSARVRSEELESEIAVIKEALKSYDL